MLPQRPFRLRLRNEYRVSVINISTKPITPIMWPKKLLAAGMDLYIYTTQLYIAVMAIIASNANQSSLFLVSI